MIMVDRVMRLVLEPYSKGLLRIVDGKCTPHTVTVLGTHVCMVPERSTCSGTVKLYRYVCPGTIGHCVTMEDHPFEAGSQTRILERPLEM